MTSLFSSTCSPSLSTSPVRGIRGKVISAVLPRRSSGRIPCSMSAKIRVSREGTDPALRGLPAGLSECAPKGNSS